MTTFKFIIYFNTLLSYKLLLRDDLSELTASAETKNKIGGILYSSLAFARDFARAEENIFIPYFTSLGVLFL